MNVFHTNSLPSKSSTGAILYIFDNCSLICNIQISYIENCKKKTISSFIITFFKLNAVFEIYLSLLSHEKIQEYILKLFTNLTHLFPQV